MKHLSTSAFAKNINIPAKELFARFSQLGIIAKDEEKWVLTDLGVQYGGSYKESKQYGTYIVWPESLELPEDAVQTIHEQAKAITATKIGTHFSISAVKTNFILSELGWVTKSLKGWSATEQGLKQGAIQAEASKSGIPYVRWPETILTSSILLDSVEQIKGISTSTKSSVTNVEEIGFREKFPAEHRTTDGHFVRSKAETLIDNWLYMAEIVHAYERKLPIEEDVYCDFYIPTGKVYIEYWGYDNDSKYLKRKTQKQDIYKKYGFNLIELVDEDVKNLDDVLPRLLLKHGVQAY